MLAGRLRLLGAVLAFTLVLTSILAISPVLDWDTAATLVSPARYLKSWSGLTPPYGISSYIWPDGAKSRQTLGVAEKIYVLSLPGREDRRKDMERLRKSLGLRWTYESATGAGELVIADIMSSIRHHRQYPPLEFIWPSAPELAASKNGGLFDKGFLVSKATNLEDQSEDVLPPLTCNAENNTVTLYSPTIRGYMLLTAPRIACWYSHLSLLGKVADDNLLLENDTVIILEDDVDMEKDIHQRLEYLWPFLPHDWDIVYLGHCWSDETAKPALNNFELDDAPAFPATFLYPSNKPYCTHAYAVSKGSARKILSYLRYTPFAFSRAIDQALSWLIQSERIKAYSIVPSIVVQRKLGNSNIMPGKGSSWKGQLKDGVLTQ